jgi:hypothetical protein
MTTVRYLTVAQWGGRWAGTPAVETLLDPEVYVHHVGGGAWMGGTVAAGEAASRAAFIRILQDLNSYAINSKGYSFLDYDVLVWYDRFNKIIWVAEGRGKYRSAATLDRNEQGEAVCVCGNFSLRAPLPQELEAAAYGIKFGMDNGWISKQAVGSWIRGHRDNPAHPEATRCPGNYYYPELPKVRTLVDQLLGAPPVVVTPTPPGVPKVMKYGGTPAEGWGGWYSFDGVTRLACRSMADAQHLTVTLEGLDAKTGRRPTDIWNWSDVSHTNDVAELDKYLIPNKPAPAPTPPPPPTGGTVLLYKVRSGDSYWRIAETVHADGKATTARVAAIQNANGSKALHPGDIINIPGRVS